jgi:hypothetical protein
MAIKASLTMSASVALLLAIPAFAQTVATPAGQETAADRVPYSTRIEISIDEPFSSQTRKTGDMCAISLAQPVLLSKATVIAARTKGQGQIVHASKRSRGGRAGDLVLAARYLALGNRRIALRGMILGGVGKTKSFGEFSGLSAKLKPVDPDDMGPKWPKKVS